MQILHQGSTPVGTTPGMEEVEPRQEQCPRIMQERLSRTKYLPLCHISSSGSDFLDNRSCTDLLHYSQVRVFRSLLSLI